MGRRGESIKWHSIGLVIVKYRLFLLGLIPLGVILTALARQFPDAVEQIFSQRIYPVLMRSWGGLTSLLPFSLTELIFVGLIVFVAVMLVKGIVFLVRRKQSARHALLIFCKLAAAGACVYFVFVIFCGLNYHRSEFSSLTGMKIAPSSSEELAAMCEDLAAKANVRREGLSLDESGNMRLDGNSFETSKAAASAMNGMSEKGYPLLFEARIIPKPFVFSQMISMVNITGFYFPITAEANIDIDVPDYTIPAAMCHELAHTRGFMREDEANFIAYLTCELSDNDEFRYSGTMLALVYSMNKLCSADPEAHSRICATYSEGVLADFISNNVYWKQFEGVPAQVGNAVNNTYLRANAQADGIQSYGRMVDLLLADYKAMKDG